MISTRPARRSLGLALVAVALAFGWSAFSAETDHATAPSPGTAAGLTVQIDPENGIVPLTHQNPPPTSGVARSLGKSSSSVEIVEHPGGMRSAVLHEGFMSTSVARITEDGRVVTDCLDSAEEVEEFLAEGRGVDGVEVR